MNWKRYQNELIILGAFVLMFGTYMYKYIQVKTQTEYAEETKHSLQELKEVVALKKIWGSKEITKQAVKLKALTPASKTTWIKKGTMVTASYKGLSPSELNLLITKILNTPVEVTLLDIKKIGLNYNVEFKCKW